MNTDDIATPPIPGILESLHQPDGWIALAALVLVLVLSWALALGMRRLAVKHLGRRLEPPPGDIVPRWLPSGMRLASVLLLLPAIAMLRRLGLPTPALELAWTLAVALVLARMIALVLEHRIASREWLATLNRGIAIAAATFVTFNALGWLPAVEGVLDEIALRMGNTRISLLDAVQFATALGLGVLVALALSDLLVARLERAAIFDKGLRLALGKIANFFLLFVAFLFAINAVGIDLTIFAVFGGALGVGLGLGLQRIVSNFVSGIILAIEGSVRIGDLVHLAGAQGVVTELRSRHAVIHTGDGHDVIVPNENLLTTNVTSLTYGSDRQARLRVPVQIRYGADPEQAIRLLLDAATRHPRVLKHPEPQAQLLRFGARGIQLELMAWIDDPAEGGAEIQSDLNRAIYRELGAAGMEITGDDMLPRPA